MQVFTDHKCLKYIFTQEELSLRQQRWMELLADYGLKIEYHPGKANQVADALSQRRADVSSAKTAQELSSIMASLRLCATRVDGNSAGLEALDQADLLWQIRQAQQKDAGLREMVSKEVVGYRSAENGTILFRGRVCVLREAGLRSKILKQAHQSQFSIHPGKRKMYQDLKNYYHWDGMKRDVEAWISQCQTCQLVKAERGVPSGLLQGLPIPLWKWDMVTMDFVTGLPRTPGNKDAIWVIVDRLMKSAHFLLIKKTDGAEMRARKYLEEIVKLHGVPVSIVSDRDPKFTSIF